MSSDPLEDVFTLEDRFYTQGHNQGAHDGILAGRSEGRSLGMHTGFDKFRESSRLAAKAVIWANRIPPAAASSSSPSPADQPTATPCTPCTPCTLPPLQSNARLRKNVASLYALVEPGTLSTKNEDSAVQDFDDRLKRAQGKAKIVEKMLGGGSKAERPAAASPSS